MTSALGEGHASGTRARDGVTGAEEDAMGDWNVVQNNGRGTTHAPVCVIVFLCGA